jgi:hypothetical protein
MHEEPLQAIRLAADEGQSRRAFRFREYAVLPDEEPDAEAWKFAFECRDCKERGPASDSSDAAFDWTLGHLKATKHLAYREHITRPYRAIPGRWQ